MALYEAPIYLTPLFCRQESEAFVSISPMSSELSGLPGTGRDNSDTIHPPRPDAENRFYAVTVGCEPGVYGGK